MEREHIHGWLMQAPAVIAQFTGPNHIVTSANQRMRELIGPNSVGTPARSALGLPANHVVFDLLDQVYTSGEPYIGTEFAIQFPTARDGALEEHVFNFVLQPVTDGFDLVEGIFIHGIDVTEHVRARRLLEAEVAERARAESLLAGQKSVLELVARGAPLRRTLETLAVLIESESGRMLCSIMLCDPDGTRLVHGAAPSLPAQFNQAIDGLQIGPAAGSPGAAAYLGEPVIATDIATDPVWADFRDLALAYGLAACWAIPIRAADRQVVGAFAVYYRQRATPTPGERELVNVLSYLAGIAITRHRDEEERAELLQRERAARKDAEEAVRARDEFLSIASHELRTPITIIKGVTQLIQRSTRRGTMDNERLFHNMAAIAKAGDRLSLLVNDLLDVSRLQSGKLALRLERLDLGTLVQEVVDRHAEQIAHEHLIQVTPIATPALVEVDAGRTEQILDNLLENAVKYSPPGSTILVSTSRDDTGFTITVKDAGIGLPEGSGERIFEPFGRATNAVTGNLPGMGLGLFISRRIAELHGGRLWAESPGEGQGTSLRLWLPEASTPGEVPDLEPAAV